MSTLETPSPPPVPPAPPSPLGAVRAALLSRPRLTWGVVLTLAAVVPFLGSLQNPPVLDDGWTALQNPLVWSLRNVGRIFTNLYGWAGSPSVRGPYRPVTTLSYALNWAVHRGWMPGFHAVNLALHAVASLLVAALAAHLARAAGSRRAGTVALLAGLVFAVHPAHVEAVVTLYGRTEPLSAVFALWALLLALRSRGSALRLLAAVGVLACGILAKEMAVTVPGLYLLIAAVLPRAAGLDRRPGIAHPEARRALARSAGVAAALGVAFLPYLAGHGTELAVAPVARWFPPGTPPSSVALTMSRVLGEYLRILVFPAFLGGDFAYAARIPTLSAATFGFALATAAWLATLAGGAWLARRAPVVGIGTIWIFVALLPVLQLVPVGVLLAERLLYLPSVGFCLALGWLLAALLPSPVNEPEPSRPRRRPAPPSEPPRSQGSRWIVRAGIAAVLVALCTRTVVRSLDWTSDLAFWESELAKAPREVVVNNNLAVAYTARGEAQKAIPRLETALAVNPGYWRAWINLGLARAHLGQRAASHRAFEEAIRLAPTESDPFRFLARTLRREGDLAGAARAFERARRNAPEQAVLAREHAIVLYEAGRRDEARSALEDAVRLDPSDAATRERLRALPR